MSSATDTFSVCFNMMKLKYVDFDKTFNTNLFLSPGDKINVFINLESILRNLSTTRDLDRKVFDCHDFSKIMISNIINLAAHYRRFFRGNGLDTRIYIYYTDTTSSEFNENEYNDDYRMYYINKYSRNPRYVLMGETLHDDVFPRAKTIMDFIPGVYLISSRNIEGSLVPGIIRELDSGRKNIILTSDIVETQYNDAGRSISYLLKRNDGVLTPYYTLFGYLEYLLKKQNHSEYVDELQLYANRSFYILLLACIGEKYRSVDGITNCKNASLIKLLHRGIESGKITMTTSQIEMLKDIFPGILQKQVEENYRCMDFAEMIRRLTKEQKYSITSQMVDRFDNNSLLKLNSLDFYEYRLMLEELTM